MQSSVICSYFHSFCLRCYCWSGKLDQVTSLKSASLGFALGLAWRVLGQRRWAHLGKAAGLAYCQSGEEANTIAVNREKAGTNTLKVPLLSEVDLHLRPNLEWSHHCCDSTFMCMSSSLRFCQTEDCSKGANDVDRAASRIWVEWRFCFVSQVSLSQNSRKTQYLVAQFTGNWGAQRKQAYDAQKRHVALLFYLKSCPVYINFKDQTL